MTREIKSQKQREEDNFTKAKFDELLTLWLKEKPGRSLRSFAEQLKPPKTQGEISRWRSTKYTAHPDDHYVNEISAIFKVDPSVFEMQEKDKYTYNTDTVNQYIKDKYYRFLERHDLEGFSSEINQHFYNMNMSFHTFLIFIKSLSRYNIDFPLWTRIIRAPELDIKDEEAYCIVYKRAPYTSLPNAAPSDLPEFQVDKGDDGIKVLQDEDIEYLISLYDRVQEFIYNDFKIHKSELEEGAWKASAVHTYNLDEAQELTDEEMCLIDSYYIHTYTHKKFEEMKKGDEK